MSEEAVEDKEYRLFGKVYIRRFYPHEDAEKIVKRNCKRRRRA